jgi:hypothetical protein
MARRETRETTRGKADCTRGGKRASPTQGKARRGAARGLKRAATTPDGTTAVPATVESEAEPAGPRGSRDETRAHAAPNRSDQLVPSLATPAASEWSWIPTGVRRSLEALTVDAEQVQIEKGELKAVVCIRRGDELLYSERVNFDWSGGRDKFLRKAARALALAGVTTHISEALVAELRTALRTRPEKPPAGTAARRR